MYKLKYISGHIYVEINGLDWLVDTGSPSSFGSLNNLKIENKIFTILPSLLNLDVTTLSKYVEHEVAGLIGTDILNQFYIIFDSKNGKITFSVDPLVLEGEILDIDEIMGIPSIAVTVDNDEGYMFFDTGAQISYIQQSIITKNKPTGIIKDFYPGVGQFETETAVIDLQLGNLDYTLQCGYLPEILNMTLMMTNTIGIIGNETIQDAVVGYFPKENKLIFNRSVEEGKRNIFQTNSFESLCFLASNENWCWNLSCTTCGNMHFRYGFVELANLKLPGTKNWLVHTKTSTYKKIGDFPRTYSLKQKSTIQEICIEANLQNIAKQCTHPDWLGYLGLVLVHINSDTELFQKLSISWAQQLRLMVYKNSAIDIKLQEIADGNGLLSINDLESCEYSFKRSDYELHKPISDTI